MVAVTKYIILGLGILAATFFFKEAAGSTLTGTLHRTGLAGQSLGSGIASTGAGVGEFGVRLLDPFFSLADLFSKFGNLFGGGNGEVITQVQTPPVQTTGGVTYIGSTNRSPGPGPGGGGEPSSGGGTTANGSTGTTANGSTQEGSTGGGGRPNPRFGGR